MEANDDGELKVDPADVKPLIRLCELVNSISLTSRWLLCTSSSLKYRSTVRLSCLSYSGPWLFFAFPTLSLLHRRERSHVPLVRSLINPTPYQPRRPDPPSRLPTPLTPRQALKLSP